VLAVWLVAVAGLDAAAGCAPVADAARQEEALQSFRAGEESLAAGAWDEAAARFADAARLDALLPLARYGLGQAHMGAQRYAQAVQAFTDSREAFRCLASTTATERADARKRLDGGIRELHDVLHNLERDEMIRSSIPRKEVNGLPTGNLGEAMLQAQRVERVLRELEGWKRQIARGDVPAEVYLALGNAYFQSGSLPDAEREFLAALRADSRSGDVQNNLAVVYMLTGRLDEAEEAVKRAEKAGVPVNPRLREELQRRRLSAR
jgi:tetratricopeptide (TPR) repeat protein